MCGCVGGCVGGWVWVFIIYIHTHWYVNSPELSSKFAVELESNLCGHTHHVLAQSTGQNALRGNWRGRTGVSVCMRKQCD